MILFEKINETFKIYGPVERRRIPKLLLLMKL